MMSFRTKDIGYAAFLLVKGIQFKESHNGTFIFDIKKLDQKDLQNLKIEYVNSGYESFHSNLKLLLDLRRK
jgi:hypothetical protein